MDVEELQALQGKFRQGLEKLGCLGKCLARLAEREGLEIKLEGIDESEGELTFRFAGNRYYVRIRLTDRSAGDVSMSYPVAQGWLDWGRFNSLGAREPPEQANYYEERGLLCELDKEEFYCSLKSCDDERLLKGLLQKLQRLIARTIAVNNAQAV